MSIRFRTKKTRSKFQFTHVIYFHFQIVEGNREISGDKTFLKRIVSFNCFISEFENLSDSIFQNSLDTSSSLSSLFDYDLYSYYICWCTFGDSVDLDQHVMTLYIVEMKIRLIISTVNESNSRLYLYSWPVFTIYEYFDAIVSCSFFTLKVTPNSLEIKMRTLPPIWHIYSTFGRRRCTSVSILLYILAGDASPVYLLALKKKWRRSKASKYTRWGQTRVVRRQSSTGIGLASNFTFVLAFKINKFTIEWSVSTRPFFEMSQKSVSFYAKRIVFIFERGAL